MRSRRNARARGTVAEERIVLSVPWSWSFEPPEDLPGVHLVRRPSDWNISRGTAAVRSLGAVARLVREVRRGDHVVLCTLGPTAGIYAALVRVRRPARVAVFDFLYSPRGAAPLVRRLLGRGVDLFLVIRRGDRAMLGRNFGVGPDRTSFLPWAVSDEKVFSLTATDGDYLYAAGWAHRDWATLLKALALYPVPAVLAPGRPLSQDVPVGVRIIDMPSPEVGRQLAAGARAVAVLLEDCEFAAGPLVLLDALAMGKPVIANDVNGNRDYVEAGVTALMVPPGDPVALSEALREIWTRPQLRSSIGQQARTHVLRNHQPDVMWRALLAAVRSSRA